MTHITFIEKQLQQAATHILKNYPVPPQKIHKKSKKEIVTPVDKEIEKNIIQNINKTYPEHTIIGEETGKTQNGSEYTWIIDPIDGTTNYAHNIPFFCTAITLLKNNEPIHAGIIQPITKDIWLASKGKGATKNNTPIQTSTTAFKNSLFGYCHKNTDIHKTLKIVEYLKKNSHDARRYGSANLEIALVADGGLQGFIGHNLPPWDFKPGCLILQEAHGTITGWNQENWKDPKTKNILATQQKPQKQLLDILCV